MDKADRAQHAASLLSDPVLVEAYSDVEKRAFDRIKNSQPDEFEIREAAYHEIRAINQLKKSLESSVNTIKLEAFKRRS